MATAREETTFVMIKPEGVQRGFVGEIISRFERRGFQLVGIKMIVSTKELAEQHYKEHSAKPFFPGLVQYIQSGPVVCMVWKGLNVVRLARKMTGATNPCESEPGTIRGDLALDIERNVIHSSDSIESAQREIGIWFSAHEIKKWDSSMQNWL